MPSTASTTTTVPIFESSERTPIARDGSTLRCHMRFAWIVLALLACNDHPAKTRADVRVTSIEQLADSDRGELISLTGTVSNVEARKVHEELRISFRLSHGERNVVVVSKGVLPEAFRERVTARVIGRWVATRTVRDDLDREGFTNVTSEDVFL